MKGSCHYDKRAKRWFIQIYWGGDKHRFWKHPITGEPFWVKKSAEKQLSRIRTEVDDGTFNPKYWKPNSPMAVDRYAEEWLEEIDVSPKTLTGYKTAVKHINKFFHKSDIRSLFAHRDIVRFYKSLELIRKKANIISSLSSEHCCVMHGAMRTYQLFLPSRKLSLRPARNRIPHISSNKKKVLSTKSLQ
jgi:hypothetical protein